jgi:hypothetical protein
MTSVLESSDTFNETWLHNELTCRSCSHGAAWIVGCRACPRTAYWCVDHRTLKRIEIMAERFDNYYCKGCWSQSWEWDDLFWERPI